MKYVVIPPSVTLVNPVTKEPLKYEGGTPLAGKHVTYDMTKFVNDYVLRFPSIAQGALETVRRLDKLDRLFRDQKEGAIIGVEDTDYEAVIHVLHTEAPASPLHAVQLVSFFEAWADGAKQDQKWRDAQNPLKAVAD